mgnify:CR=1 FL=1
MDADARLGARHVHAQRLGAVQREQLVAVDGLDGRAGADEHDQRELLVVAVAGLEHRGDVVGRGVEALEPRPAARPARSLAPSYVGDESLLGSFWRTLCAPGITAVVSYGAPQRAQGRDRRAWAGDLHDTIDALRIHGPQVSRKHS